ncbi:hypothetical protein V866_006399 [Kwoniella sp. B9012]|uniref:Mediator complex subunit 11 n=1 Tax=Kwoniella europaea PYCC6329 TaxID=1423913 RepID=A0AAX4KTF8_9TREE
MSSSTPISNQNQPFKTDSLLPTSLPSATLGRRRHISQTQTNPTGESENLTTEERLQKGLDDEHEKWNERIDKEIKGVVEGLKDLVELANIGPNPSPLNSSTLPLHLPLRTSSLIRSAQNLRDIAHELKLLLVLGDEQGLVQRRDHEMDLVRREIQRKRGEVGKELGGLLGLPLDEQQEKSEQQEKMDVTATRNDGQDVMMDQSENILRDQGITSDITTQPQQPCPEDTAQQQQHQQQQEEEEHSSNPNINTNPNTNTESMEVDQTNEEDDEDDFEEVS